MALLSLSVLLSACGGSNNGDLSQYIAETKRRPAGAVEPLPSFSPYGTYTYSAATLRSPFQKPARVLENFAFGSGSSDVAPDSNRTKEFLESFPLSSLQMVGSLEQNGVLWALIDDDNGGIHRVSVGNYLGLNHGRIVEADKVHLTILEIVSDGNSGWVERPDTLELQVSE